MYQTPSKQPAKPIFDVPAERAVQVNANDTDTESNTIQQKLEPMPPEATPLEHTPVIATATEPAFQSQENAEVADASYASAAPTKTVPEPIASTEVLASQKSTPTSTASSSTSSLVIKTPSASTHAPIEHRAEEDTFLELDDDLDVDSFIESVNSSLAASMARASLVPSPPMPDSAPIEYAKADNGEADSLHSFKVAVDDPAQIIASRAIEAVESANQAELLNPEQPSPQVTETRAQDENVDLELSSDEETAEATDLLLWSASDKEASTSDDGPPVPPFLAPLEASSHQPTTTSDNDANDDLDIEIDDDEPDVEPVVPQTAQAEDNLSEKTDAASTNNATSARQHTETAESVSDVDEVEEEDIELENDSEEEKQPNELSAIDSAIEQNVAHTDSSGTGPSPSLALHIDEPQRIEEVKSDEEPVDTNSQSAPIAEQQAEHTSLDAPSPELWQLQSHSPQVENVASVLSRHTFTQAFAAALATLKEASVHDTQIQSDEQHSHRNAIEQAEPLKDDNALRHESEEHGSVQSQNEVQPVVHHSQEAVEQDSHSTSLTVSVTPQEEPAIEPPRDDEVTLKTPDDDDNGTTGPSMSRVSFNATVSERLFHRDETIVRQDAISDDIDEEIPSDDDDVAEAPVTEVSSDAQNAESVVTESHNDKNADDVLLDIAMVPVTSPEREYLNASASPSPPQAESLVASFDLGDGHKFSTATDEAHMTGVLQTKAIPLLPAPTSQQSFEIYFSDESDSGNAGVGHQELSKKDFVVDSDDDF